MGFNFVTEIDSVQFAKSLEAAFKSLDDKIIVSVELSTAAVPKPIEATLQETNVDGLKTFDFVTEYSALILWKD